MKTVLISFLMLCVSIISAQFKEVSVGPNYPDQVFYDLHTDQFSTSSYLDWDIAFTTFGLQDAGVFINEAAPLEGGQALMLFNAPGETFESLTDTAGLERIYNDEESWTYGAFNNERNQMNPFDYGWGVYNPNNMTVEGSRVFALALRNGELKKIMIESLTFTTYQVKYANMDGSDLVSFSLDKNAYPNSHLAYYSLTDNQAIELEPESWDLLFTRYVTPAFLDGEFRQYVVTGVLHSPDVSVAQVDGVDPEEVDGDYFEGNEVDSIDAIGYDWKEFDFMNLSWSIVPNRSYLVMTDADRGFKIVFIDFEGSLSGNIVFTSEEVEFSTSVMNEELQELKIGTSVWKAQSVNQVFLESDLSLKDARLTLTDINGSDVFTQTVLIDPGTRSLDIHTPLKTGMYVLRVEHEGRVAGKKIVVQ